MFSSPQNSGGRRETALVLGVAPRKDFRLAELRRDLVNCTHNVRGEIPELLTVLANDIQF